MVRSFDISKVGLFAAAVTVSMTFGLMPVSAYTERTLYKFCSEKKCIDGAYPHDLAMDNQGNLYGTTFGGGLGVSRNNPIGYGTVFEFSPSSGVYQTLYKFCSQENCADGKNPYRMKLVVDTKGNLYGTASDGGQTGNGVAFELLHKKPDWQYKLLYSFCAKKSCKDSGDPKVGMTYAGASAGVLYDGVSPLFGMTISTVFQLTPRKEQSSGKKRRLPAWAVCRHYS